MSARQPQRQTVFRHYGPRSRRGRVPREAPRGGERSPGPGQGRWCTGARGVGLAEAIEHVREKCRVDAHAGIGDRQFDLTVVDARLHLDSPSGRRELHGVREEVPHRLLESYRIAHHRATGRVDGHMDADVLGAGSRKDRLDSRIDDVAQIHRRHVESHLAADHPGHVQQVLDQLRERSCIPIDRLKPFWRAIVKRRGLFEDRRPSQNGIQRRAKLVGRGGQKLVFRAIGFLGLCPRGLLAGQQARTFFLRAQRDR